MALTSVFYDGPVTETDRAKNRGGVPDYGVYGASDFQVTTNGSVPYSTLVRAGRAHGWGITDTAATNQTLTFDAPANGVTRWDLVAVRRNWQPLLGGPSTLVVVKGGSTTAIPAGRKVGPGIEDDQPLALVGWKGGQSAPFQIIDLRCWANNGGMEIVSEIAFEYLGRPGACIRFDGLEWRYARGANAVWGWETDPDATTQDSGLMSAADKRKLDGAGPSSAANKIMMTGPDGMINVRGPVVSYHPASKYYSDAGDTAARSYALAQAGSARSSAEAYARSLTADMRPVASGSRGLGSVSANGSAQNQAVNFPSGRFSKTPVVVMQSGSSRLTLGLQSVNTSGFVFTASNWTGNAMSGTDIYWVAVQN